jgi:hypothetical protein
MNLGNRPFARGRGEPFEARRRTRRHHFGRWRRHFGRRGRGRIRLFDKRIDGRERLRHGPRAVDLGLEGRHRRHRRIKRLGFRIDHTLTAQEIGREPRQRRIQRLDRGLRVAELLVLPLSG